MVVTPADVKDVEVARQVNGWVVVRQRAQSELGLKDGTLSLTVKCSGLISNCGARHEVKVPRGVAVTVHQRRRPRRGLRLRHPAEDHLRQRPGERQGLLGPAGPHRAGRADRRRGDLAKTVRAGSDNGRVALAFAVVPDSVRPRATTAASTCPYRRARTRSTPAPTRPGRCRGGPLRLQYARADRAQRQRPGHRPRLLNESLRREAPTARAAPAWSASATAGREPAEHVRARLREKRGNRGRSVN